MKVRDKKVLTVRVDETEEKLFNYVRSLVFTDETMSFNQLTHFMMKVMLMDYLHIDVDFTYTEEELLVLVENHVVDNRKKQIKLFGVENCKKMIDEMIKKKTDSYAIELFQRAISEYEEEN